MKKFHLNRRLQPILSTGYTKYLLRAKDFFNSIFHILISQTIYNGIEKGSKDRESQGNGGVPERCVSNREPEIHEGHTTKKQQEDGNVGSTGGKGLFTALS